MLKPSAAAPNQNLVAVRWTTSEGASGFGAQWVLNGLLRVRSAEDARRPCNTATWCTPGVTIKGWCFSSLHQRVDVLGTLKPRPLST